MRTPRSRYLVLAALFALVLTIAPGPGGPAVSLAGPTTNLSNGITFDHANLNDPVRMVGEPDIAIDNHGGTYVSGPGGSTTQASWFWKSEDKGIQWHLIGCPAKSNCQNGGGDTEITIANNRDVFASDLQTLQCNSTFRSYDEGKTFLPGEGCFPETDRQWMAVYDPNSSGTGRRVYLSANYVALNGCYVLVSTDNGVTYVPPNPTANPTANIGADCIGRLAVDPRNGNIYVPTVSGTRVSTDGGLTWQARAGPGAQGNFFAPIVVDTVGNLWQGWTTSCTNPATTPCKAFVSYSTNEARSWHAPIQVNTGPASPVGTSPDLRQMLFPWIVVGDAGRVALVYYATTDTARAGGFPGGPNALWHAYASISTNAMDAKPTFTQVQADEHVMHRGTICTGGFPGCLTANADRSLADFFMVDKDPQGRLYIAYNENSDLSLVVPDPPQYIGKPINAVIRLRTGPSLFAAQGNLLPDPTPANVSIASASRSGGTLSVSGTQGLPPGNWSTDPAGDAKFPVVPVESANHPALDILEASAGDDGTNLTFKLKLADLSAAALADAGTIGGAPSWVLTWWEGKGGIGPATMSAPFDSHWFVKWLGGTSFVYGKVSSIDTPALGAPTPKYLTYVPSGTADGNVIGNVVTISVPLASVGGLAAGDKLDHVSAFTFVERTDVTLNDWVDQAKTFSYRVGTPVAAQHLSDGYIEVSLDPSFGTATRATLNPANNTWTAAIAGAPSAGVVYARQILSRDLYTPVWDDVQAGPVAQLRYGSADVSVTKTDSPDPVYAEQPLTYTLTVRNNGPDLALGTMLTDAIPAGVTLGSVTPSQGSCSGTSTVACALGTLAPAASATVTIVVTPTVAAVGTLTNSASAASDTFDPNTANNSTTATTTVKPAADLAVAQQADQSTAHLGQPVTYTITVTNHGPSPAMSLTLTDTFTKNAGYAGFASIQGNWSCTAKPDKRLLTCTLSSLAAGDSAVVQLTVKPTQKGTLGNTATVKAASPDDLVSANNSSTLQIAVVP